MAKNKYYTLYTDKGRKRINELLAEGKDLTFTHIAVGDGGGFIYEPEANQEALKNEVYRGSINAKLVDPDDPNQIIFQLVIPVSVGGFYIREAGLFDDSGLMIAVAKTSESYKPNVTDGSGKEVKLSFIIALSNAENITINIPDSVTFATQEYVLQQIQKGVELHCNADDPHEQYLKEQEYNKKISEMESELESKADASHNHNSTYATKSELNTGLAGKAAASHTHSNYAANNHNHDTVYSKTNHTHTGYAANNHNHDSLYLKPGTADGKYASKSHTHSDYAVSGHNHDREYLNRGYIGQLIQGRSFVNGMGVSTASVPNGGIWLCFYMDPKTNIEVKFSKLAGGTQIASTANGYSESQITQLVEKSFVYRLR